MRISPIPPFKCSTLLPRLPIKLGVFGLARAWPGEFVTAVPPLITVVRVVPPYVAAIIKDELFVTVPAVN
jgi:hypothetical protein